MQGELPDELFPLPQAEDEVEAARQLVMQRWLREVMGGLIPEQPDLSHVQRVLDVACGAGAWAGLLQSLFAPCGRGRKKRLGDAPRPPQRGGCPFEPRLFAILQQPWLHTKNSLLCPL